MQQMSNENNKDNENNFKSQLAIAMRHTFNRRRSHGQINSSEWRVAQQSRPL